MNFTKLFYTAIDIIKTSYERNENIQVFLVILAILLFLKIFSRILSTGNIIFFLVSLPGTFFHELAHFLVGGLLLGKPSNFTIIPKKSDNGYTLGSVSFSNITMINALPIALAPLLLLPIGILAFSYSIIYLDTASFSKETVYIPILLGVSIYSIFSSFWPSSADYKILWSKKIGLLIYLVVILFFVNRYI